MHIELHRIGCRELIREADTYRLSQRARKAKPAPKATTAES
ncbi:hypothetical protein ACIBAH_22855 [Streptomyces sp. NPDC051445]